MKSNKKLVIALSIFSSVLLIAVISLVSVLAAFQAQATGGFNITYSAINVNAQVNSSYRDYNKTTNSYGTSWTNIDSVRFEDEEDTETKHVFPTIDKPLQYRVNDDKVSRRIAPLYIMFLIFNKDTVQTNNISVNGEVWTGTDVNNKGGLPSNLTLQYRIFNESDNANNYSFDSAIDTAANNTAWTTLGSDLKICSNLQIPGNRYRYIMLRAFPTNLNVSVENIKVNIDFTLSVVD